MEVLGIEIGSRTIKGAIVDTTTGNLLSDIQEVEPVSKLEPHKLVSRIHKLSKRMKWEGAIGCTFPSPIRRGVVLGGEYINDSWDDVDAEHLFSEITDNKVSVVNYTDAVGITEMTFGAGKGQIGTVLVLSISEKIGSSLFSNGLLVPNLELGQIEFKGISVEDRASTKAKKKEGFGAKAWGSRLQYIMENYERIFHPELFILGGKVIKKEEKIFPYLKIATKCKAASVKKEPGIIGAATYAAQKTYAKDTVNQ